jgi:hypothetical protein
MSLSGCGFTATSGGVTAELGSGCIGVGVFLNGNPVMTFWRSRYRQYAPFATETLPHEMVGVKFGNSNSRTNVGKTSDLIYFTYVVIQLPGITACEASTTDCRGRGSGMFPVARDCDLACSEEDRRYFMELGDTDLHDDSHRIQSGIDNYMLRHYKSCNKFGRNVCEEEERSEGSCLWAHWANAIGQLLVRQAAIIIGNQVVDLLNSDFLFIWEELSGQPGKRLTEMIGKRYSREDLIYDSQLQRYLYVPLPFFYTMAPGKALATVSMLYTQAEISVCFEELCNTIIVSSEGCAVINCATGTEIQPCDLDAWIDICHVYLDVQERDRFAVAPFTSLITQHQYLHFTNSFNNMRLEFSHPIIELIWVFRRSCAEEANMWFTYTGLLGKDPMVDAELRFNSSVRQQRREATYYRLVQPWQWHTNIPDVPIYVYSFALYPEDSSPSGAANFSRFENINLSVTLQLGLTRYSDVTCLVFARSWNALKHFEGLVGTAFTL